MRGARWYLRRLRRMSPVEVAWRVRDQAMYAAWSRRQGRGGPMPTRERHFASPLPAGTADLMPDDARKALIAAADRLMRGEWEIFGTLRTDMDAPDWFLDPVTGQRSDPEAYAFRIDHRDPDEVGDVKWVWEISRLQHVTLLGCAWYLTGDDQYARRAASQLTSWWRENPFLSGVNWTSGIEAGIRLITFTWTRRLLHDWPGVADLFERNPLAVQQIRWHQEYLAAFRSRGSSANNHVIAEAAGQLAASCAFPWFTASDRWRRRSARLLERELIRNTFPSGIGRELATDYQCFVAELGMVAAVEASAAGYGLNASFWTRLCAMVDSGAALLDSRSRPPRQGDSDEGRALLLDAPTENEWPSLLALGDAVFGRLAWWPESAPRVGAVLTGALFRGIRPVAGRPADRPVRFEDAGITIFRSEPAGGPELWCRCDGGPHGFLSIAAHAHADALSVEVRSDGVDILADPGTYCYHGEPEWRSYFRSTIAHNTVEIGGCSQSVQSGPFMWQRHARTIQIPVRDPDANWIAEHDGYTALKPRARHRRSVRFDRVGRSVEITDVIDNAGHDVVIAFQFGPDVSAELHGDLVSMAWTRGTAEMELPAGLDWSLHRGEESPPRGWYSPGFGRRVPTYTLLGHGMPKPGVPLITSLRFFDGPRPVAVGGVNRAEVR